jgi:hypothetical protein
MGPIGRVAHAGVSAREAGMTVEAMRPRPRRSQRRALVVFVALGLLVVGALSVVSAAQLTVSSSAIGVYSAARCSSATLSVHVNPTGSTFMNYNKTAVRITNYPASCNGMSVTVAVSNSAGALLATGTATCGASPCIITTGSYPALQAAGADVLIATWGVPASWDSVCTLSFFGLIMTCT